MIADQARDEVVKAKEVLDSARTFLEKQPADALEPVITAQLQELGEQQKLLYKDLEALQEQLQKIENASHDINAMYKQLEEVKKSLDEQKKKKLFLPRR
jgi:uncharacterized protein (DUF342 family)